MPEWGLNATFLATHDETLGRQCLWIRSSWFLITIAQGVAMQCDTGCSRPSTPTHSPQSLSSCRFFKKCKQAGVQTLGQQASSSWNATNMQLMVILQLEKVEAISLNCMVYRKNTNWLQKAHIRCERLQLVAQSFSPNSNSQIQTLLQPPRDGRLVI